MRLFLILSFLISTSCFAQKEYRFDHLIEYQFTSYKDSSLSKKVYYYTHSKDNSYFAKVEELDSLHFELEIREHDQFLMAVKIKKQDLFKAENLVLACNGNWTNKNDFKFRSKEYEFTAAADTLLNNLSLENYKLQYIGKRKRKQSFPVGTNHYIIKDSTEFHLPILTHPTAFEEWKEERNIPNGIFQEKIFYNHRNVIEYKYILKSYQRLNKSITFSGNCEWE